MTQSTSPDTCTVATAHCEECGGTFIVVNEVGPACDECGGQIVNADRCEGDHR